MTRLEGCVYLPSFDMSAASETEIWSQKGLLEHRNSKQTREKKK